MLSCVSQPKWGQPPVSATLLARVTHPHCQTESCSLVCLWGGDWDHLVFGRQRCLSHPEFGSPLNVDYGSASEECASASIFAPRAGSDIKRKPRKGSARLVILGETRKVSYPESYCVPPRARAVVFGRHRRRRKS